MVLTNRNCRRCGTLMKNVANNKTYCRLCAIDVHRERARAARARRRQQRAEEAANAQPRSKVRRPMTIAEVGVAAKAAGMSYGEFVRAGLAYVED